LGNERTGNAAVVVVGKFAANLWEAALSGFLFGKIFDPDYPDHFDHLD
jgi:hypothetical protein